ncbi:hypothetical protein SHKM778_66160 [Streptomyces sp. KM77-8]|uniref:AB hydrolase-1 domain-containing protein n=1 Tax=Streptomyces haneummycinicus TaxID=3074435 RepID=A0AAT9HST3_9ACTN
MLLTRNLTSEQHPRDPDHRAQDPHPRTARRSRDAALEASDQTLAALLLAAGLTLPTAAGAHAAAAPGSGWNDWSCRPTAAHPRPVVLVHGTFGNSVDNWLGLAPYLKNRGYCVFSLDYGQLPGVPLFHGLGPTEKSAEQLDAYVDKVLAATGARETDLVGHSQGGMMPRHYLKFLGGADEVNALIGIAPSNHGTTLSGLTRLLPYFPGAEDLLSEATPPSPTRSPAPTSSPGSTRAATPCRASATPSSPPATTRSSPPTAARF